MSIIIKFKMKFIYSLDFLFDLDNYSRWLTQIQRCVDQRVDLLEKLLFRIVVSMRLDPGGPFEWYTQREKMIVVYVHVHLNADELERYLGRGCLAQSSTTVIIPTWYHLVVLVYLVALKIKHRKEIVSY